MQFLRLFLSLTIVIAFLSKLMVVDFKFGNLFHKDHTQKYKLVCLNKSANHSLSKGHLFGSEVKSSTKISSTCHMFCTPSFIFPEIHYQLPLKNLAISNPNSKIQFFINSTRSPTVLLLDLLTYNTPY